MFLLEVGAFEDIKRDRVVLVGGIEVDDVINAMTGNVLEYARGRFAVRVDKTNPVVLVDVLENHIFDERCFSRAGFAQNVHMPTTIVDFDAELSGLIPEVRDAEVVDLRTSGGHREI